VAGSPAYNRGSHFTRSFTMTVETDRRAAVAALAGLAGTLPALAPSSARAREADASAGARDFDFFFGRWQVRHRRLRERLAGSREWIEFDGTSVAQPLLGGFGNVDDNVFALDGHTVRGVTLRSFDPATGQWSIWYLDTRAPLGPLDPPVRGSFRDGVGTFHADDTFAGRPIKVRFTWSAVAPSTPHWEQAFSADVGATWETNWEMDFRRA